MEQQLQGERGSLEKDVVKILQKKGKVVRNTVERNRCVVIFGDIEKTNQLEMPINAR